MKKKYYQVLEDFISNIDEEEEYKYIPVSKEYVPTEILNMIEDGDLFINQFIYGISKESGSITCDLRLFVKKMGKREIDKIDEAFDEVFEKDSKCFVLKSAEEE